MKIFDFTLVTCFYTLLFWLNSPGVLHLPELRVFEMHFMTYSGAEPEYGGMMTELQ